MASVTVNTYEIGNVCRLEATFLVGTTPTNPTTLVVKVEDPTGVSTDMTAQVTTPNTGVKRLDFSLTGAIPGEYWARFTGTGTAEASKEGRFYVTARQVA